MIANNNPFFRTVSTVIASIDSLVSRGATQDVEQPNRCPYLGHVPHFAPRACASAASGEKTSHVK